MDVKNIVIVAISVLIISVVLVPIIDGMTLTTEARENASPLAQYEQATTLAITAADGSITVNGEAYTPSSLTYLAIADDFVVYASATTAFTLASASGYATSLTSLTLTSGSFTLATASGAYTGDPIITTSSSFLVIADEGDYGAWNHSTTAINTEKNSKLYLVDSAVTLTGTSSYTGIIVLMGTVNDLDVEFAINTAGASVTTPAVTLADNTVVKNDAGYYEFKSGSASVTGKVSTDSVTGTMGGMVIAPIEYTATVPDDSTTSTILKIIPLFVAIGIILALAGDFFTRRT